jgi:hypothetical protein
VSALQCGRINEEGATAMEGFLRPPSTVLPENAVVPDRNLIVPAPNTFTHTLTSDQPFSYTTLEGAAVPDGELAKGTSVVLMVYDGGHVCRVVDGRGLYVEIACQSLKPLEQSPAT